MADTVPAPVLDGRNGDLLVAEAIGSLPSELSDRSNSNPAVVILEAAGAIFDALEFQLNRWPRGVIQKVLNLIGITLGPATAAVVPQTFTLTSPQSTDTIIPAGTQIAINDGTVVFATLADLTISAYTTPLGTITMTAGSVAVVGASTTFLSNVQAGWAISVDGSTWYTVASVTDNTHLVLASTALLDATAAAWRSGQFNATINAQCSTLGSSTNIAAGLLTTLVNQPAGVTSTVNNAAATGGNDQETVANAILRAPKAFAARDVACSVSDYEYFAQRILGINSRVKALANSNAGVLAPGFVTTALLSPGWTTTSTVSTQERASVIRDFQARTFVGSNTIDIPANLDRFDIGSTVPAVMVWRKSTSESALVTQNIAAALNSFLNPNTYTWGRTIYTADLVQAVEAVPGVDRVHSINGVPIIGMSYQVSANTISFVNGSTSATANAADIGAGKLTKNSSILFGIFQQPFQYQVTNIVGTTLTITPAWSEATVAATMAYINVGDTALSNAWTLPFSNLSTDPDSIRIVGQVLP